MVMPDILAKSTRAPGFTLQAVIVAIDKRASDGRVLSNPQSR
jgi:hypothetical protein